MHLWEPNTIKQAMKAYVRSAHAKYQAKLEQVKI